MGPLETKARATLGVAKRRTPKARTSGRYIKPEDGRRAENQSSAPELAGHSVAGEPRGKGGLWTAGKVAQVNQKASAKQNVANQKTQQKATKKAAAAAKSATKKMQAAQKKQQSKHVAAKKGSAPRKGRTPSGSRGAHRSSASHGTRSRKK